MINITWDPEEKTVRVSTSTEGDITLVLAREFECTKPHAFDRPVLAVEVQRRQTPKGDENGFELSDTFAPGSETWIVHPGITLDAAKSVVEFLRKEITHGLLRR